MKKPNFTLGIEPEKIAKKVLLTSDPELCAYVAEKYMKNYEAFNINRNYPGFTGTYFGKPVTVISAGIGMGAMGLLAEELYQVCGVESVIYVSTCDSLKEEVKTLDCVLALSASTDSNYPDLLGLPGAVSPTADFGLTQAMFFDFKKRKEAVFAENDTTDVHVGPVLSSDRRITDTLEAEEWAECGTLAADMATAALFVQAMKAGKKAASLLLIDRNVITGTEMPATEMRYKAPQFPLMRQIVIALSIL